MLQLRRDTRGRIVAGLMPEESNADDGAALFRTGEDKNRLALAAALQGATAGARASSPPSRAGRRPMRLLAPCMGRR